VTVSLSNSLKIRAAQPDGPERISRISGEWAIMTLVRTLFVASVLSLWLALTTRPLLAQAVAQEERVQVIVTKPGPPAQKGKQTKSQPTQLPEGMRDALKQQSGETSGHSLSLTKAEVWSVPKSKVETLKQLAGQHGTVVTEVGPESQHIFRTPPADVTMSAKQKAIMEQAKAAKSAMGAKLVMGPRPEMLGPN
jgi:hypothetical protein